MLFLHLLSGAISFLQLAATCLILPNGGRVSERPVRLVRLLFWIVQNGFLMGHDL
jgi:hypothetical protein